MVTSTGRRHNADVQPKRGYRRRHGRGKPCEGGHRRWPAQGKPTVCATLPAMAPPREAMRSCLSTKSNDEACVERTPCSAEAIIISTHPCLEVKESVLFGVGDGRSWIESNGCVDEGNNCVQQKSCLAKATASAAQWLSDGLKRKSLATTLRSSAEVWLASESDRLFCDVIDGGVKAASDQACMAERMSLPMVRSRRQVCFEEAAASVCEVTPYSEIYGRHPRSFVFDREANMIPAAPCGFVSFQSWYYGVEEDEEEEIETEQHNCDCPWQTWPPMTSGDNEDAPYVFHADEHVQWQ